MKKIKINWPRFLIVWFITILITILATTLIVNASKEQTVEYKVMTADEYLVFEKDYERSMNNENKLQSIIEEVEEIKPIKTSLGQYTITKYCSCSKCCGSYAKGRPIKEDGTELVMGAYGTELTPDYSVASTLPYGTKIEIEGLGVYRVEDTTSNWVADKYNGKVIDIYVSDHSLATGKEVLQVWEVE